MNIEILMQYMSYILAGIGVLAFLVSGEGGEAEDRFGTERGISCQRDRAGY